MFTRYLVQPSGSSAFVLATVAGLVLLICGIMPLMLEQTATSDCCAAVRSVHPQVPDSVLAVLPPTFLVAWLFALSPGLSHALVRRLQLPSPRVLCLLC